MSIRSKFRLGFALLLATFAAFGWYTIEQTLQLNRQFREVINRSLSAMITTDEMTVATSELANFEAQALLDEDAGLRSEHRARAKAIRRRIRELELQYREFYSLPSHQVVLDELAGNLDAFLETLDKQHATHEAERGEVSRELLEESVRRHKRVIGSLVKLDQVASRMAREAASASAETAARKSRLGVATAVVIVALVLLGLTALTDAHILRDIRRLVEAIDSLAKGDIAIVVPLTKQRNELGDVARALEQFRLNALDRERLQKQEAHDLEFARRIQLAGVPRRPRVRSDDGTFEICGRLVPSRTVSGDFLDFHQLDSHRLAVAIGDASGKGVASAMFAGWARGTLKSESLRATSPGGCLTAANRVLARRNQDMMFVTAFYGILDLADGSFSFANAGHELPYLLNSTDGVRQLAADPGLPLGVTEKIDFQTSRIRLVPSDAIVLFTDGITEAAAADDRLFGRDRLIKLLADHRQADCDALLDMLLGAVREFSAGVPPSDDIALIALRYNAPAQPVGQTG
ncbi:MAG: SpoIIE family protein phosphatase [Alphaproteobacteria bacterium]|nr:SpoIIE family protein phosphatase [Alphaproteobacteria bacterium]MBV8410094.1 SpoIIE family protein phosphatase [Alphaproteobacteria bacterium]